MFRILVSIILVMLFSSMLFAEDNVVAKVNNTVLTDKDLEAQVDRLILRATFHRNVPIEKRKRFYDKAIEELITRELQYQDAIARGIQLDKEKADSQMETIRKKFKSEDGLKAALKREGLTEEQLRAREEKDIIIQTVIAKTVNEPAQITESALKDYYEKNITKFKQPESVKIRLISTKDEKKANEILVKIKAGEDFGDIAYNMSEDDYRVKGGELTYMHKGRMLPAIDDVAFNMKAGEVSDIIKADDKWYIIKMEDKKLEHQIPYEEIKVKLKKDMEAKLTQELNEKWMADLKAKAKIEIFLKKESTDKGE
ncbi:MAG: peptidyl-prolyl cis-trans isomerase [Thermodesulfovibrionales bacterium]